MIIKHQHFDLLDKVVLERVVFNPPLKALDNMQDEACFLYAINGSSTLYGGKDQQELTTDQSILMKCGTYINNWHHSLSEDPNEAVAIHFYPDVLKLIFNDEVPSFLANNNNPNPKQFQLLPAHEAIRSFVHSLLFYFDNPGHASEELIKLKVKELILLMYNTNSNGIRDILHDLFNPGVAVFKQIIKCNLYEDLSLEDFAQLTNLSLSSFKRKFKETFDESPARYIKYKRLEKAAELLKVSSKRVSEICFDCGFNDLGHFSKSFVMQYDYSPSEYRKHFVVQKNQ